MYPDLSARHDWSVKNAIVDLPIRLKENLKYTELLRGRYLAGQDNVCLRLASYVSFESCDNDRKQGVNNNKNNNDVLNYLSFNCFHKLSSFPSVTMPCYAARVVKLFLRAGHEPEFFHKSGIFFVATFLERSFPSSTVFCEARRVFINLWL